MNIKDYTSIHGRKIKYLKEKITFFNSELKEEELFFKFIKKSEIQIDDIVPCNSDKKSGAIIYTRDYSLMNFFRKLSLVEKFDAPYNKQFLSLDINKDEIEFYSKIKVDDVELNNFEIILKDHEMISKKYNEILKGKNSWQLGYDKKLNEKYLSEINERIKYFQEKGMNEKLVEKIERYLRWFADGLDPEDDNSR